MDTLQVAVCLMALMGIAFAVCIKLLFDAFIVHLKAQSELTTRAVNQAGEAVALNGRILTTLAALASGKGKGINTTA